MVTGGRLEVPRSLEDLSLVMIICGTRSGLHMHMRAHAHS